MNIREYMELQRELAKLTVELERLKVINEKLCQQLDAEQNLRKAYGF